MRVSGGSARGRRLRVPKSGVRPTPDRVREALFSILYDRVAQARVLDLFAGSGSFGIEALSRGAAQATFVEKNKKTVEILKENLNTVGLREDAQVFHTPADRAIPKLIALNLGFDICFLDPPYDAGLLEKTLHKLTSSNLPASDSCIVCEHHSQAAPPREPTGWSLQQTRSYGDVTVSFYLPNENEEAP